MIFGDKIRELREARDWSQAELARRSGVAQPTISSIEAGEQRTSRKLPKIAAALEVKVSDLDPEFKDLVGVLDRSPSEILETAELAFETMIQALREGLTPEARKDLGLIFVKLVREPLAGNTSESRAEEMRLRLVQTLMKGKS